jgi:hypothetical protein
MPYRTTLFRWAGLAAAALALLTVPILLARPEKAATPTTGPWGVSSSASSLRDHAEWFPKMSAAGITSVRLFPEWRGIEPKKGTWKWDNADALVKSAADNKIEITGILMGSSHKSKKAHEFPMDDLPGWEKYVAAVVGRYKGKVQYWEVWNEGNGGFNDGKHTTKDYAKLAISTYAAAKKANPDAKVGLSVASFDAPYLNQVILAMKKEGKPNSFDHVCIHPYEIADGINSPDGEIPFLWMAHTLRQMLKASAPDRANAEIWISEVGHRVERRGSRNITEEDAAKALVKIYTMALAQGIARTQWFEGRDPLGEPPGFGLLKRDGKPRASYTAIKELTKRLGPSPKYVGWLALGAGYGFVFEGGPAPVLITWMPAGQKSKAFFPTEVERIDPIRGASTKLKPREALEFTDSPIFLAGISGAIIKAARENASKPFPWGGNFAKATAVSVELGKPGGNKGIVQLNPEATPTIKFHDGSTGILVRGDQAVSFFVHPTFAGFATKEYHVRATVRRVAPGNVGMNLFYEVADSQGRTPYKNRGIWFGASKDDGWQTYTWSVTDACFSKMWGYDLSLRPEKSVPFVIGKVEVSTVPFKKAG